MSQTTFSTMTGSMNINVPLNTLDPDTQLDLLYGLLRQTGMAFEPGLKRAMEDIHVVAQSRRDPLNKEKAEAVLKLRERETPYTGIDRNGNLVMKEQQS